MAKERKTESLLEQAFRAAGYSDADIQFQGSDDDEIQRCLPSKRSGKAGSGRPEHIIRLNGRVPDILVTECKLSKADHASAPDLTEASTLKATKYAEDGVIHYMKGLRKKFNVIGLAVSGTDTVDTLQITTFMAMRKGSIIRLPGTTVLKREDYISSLHIDDYKTNTEEEIIIFAKKLHEHLRDQMELSEADKPLIVSGILLALMDTSFEASFSATTNNDDLADNLVKAIEHTLKKNRVKDQKITAMIPGYTFIQTNKAVKAFLPETIKKIHENLFFTLQPNKSIDILGSFDLLGSFYGEFLRYSGGDQQGLGIVLTPRHITELFADMARLNPEKSVVLDPCAGTGGFLIASMANMVQHTGNDSEIIKRIKNEGLVGIELDQHMFTLSCANMIFRGDGKSNMFWDDCLAPDNETKMHISELKPNVAMLNPPYSKKAKGKHELVFVKQALDLLKDSGYCFAIVPVGALIGEQKETVRLKKDIMAKHRLHAVMSMPAQLFPGVGAVTAIVVLEANRPHCRSEKQPVFDDNGNQMFDGNGKPVMKTTNIPISETWFGYWRDDGLRLNKNRRTERTPGLWEEIKEEWLDAYFNQREVSGRSCKKAVTHVDEWLAEAYMETDYSALTQEDFNREIKKFLLYNLMLDIQGGDEEEDVNDEA